MYTDKNPLMPIIINLIPSIITPDELENNVMYENILTAANSDNALFITLPIPISLTHMNNTSAPDIVGYTLVDRACASRCIHRSSIAAQSL